MPKMPETSSGKVTDHIIANLKPINSVQTEYSHPRQRGFGVVVSACGLRRQYFVRGMLNGKQVFRSLGAVNDQFPLERALAEAIQWREKMKIGIDPKAEREEAKAKRVREKLEAESRGITLRQGLAIFLEKKKGHVRQSTLDNYRHDIERYMGGDRYEKTKVVNWMDVALGDISRSMVEAMHRGIRDNAIERGYKGEFAADKALLSLRSVYSFLNDDDESRCLTDPTRKVSKFVKRPMDKARTRYIEIHQMKAWFTAVLDYSINETHRELVLLILFTGLRRQEACGLRWDDVNAGVKTHHWPE